MTVRTEPPRMTSPMMKLALAAQVFLLRRNWMGKMSDVLMVITTTGRKSGKQFSTPIGFVRDGQALIAFNIGGASNWYKNALKNPGVTLTVKGKAGAYRAESVDMSNDQVVLAVLSLYRKQAPDVMSRFLKVDPNAPDVEALKVRERLRFVRFTPA